jgi:hypothetical protein
MATLFKPTRPFPLPVDAEIIDRDSKPHVRIKERGKSVFYPLKVVSKMNRELVSFANATRECTTLPAACNLAKSRTSPAEN